MKKTIKIEGMMCEHCEARVREALEAIGGVEKAAVSHKKGEAEVICSEDVSDEILKTAVRNQGYKA